MRQAGWACQVQAEKSPQTSRGLLERLGSEVEKRV